MPAPDWTIDFPTLGDLVDAWITAHCVVPDMWQRGSPFRLTDQQFWVTANHYRVRPDVKYNVKRPPLNQAFVYRRSQIVGAQKSGKGPHAATLTCVEAVGPSQFCGWAKSGDVYECSDHGCGCGFRYRYLAGEPMGRRHPSPLIQLTAMSEDQVDNTWRPLTAMIRLGPLKKLMAPRQDFIRILGGFGDPDLDRIDAVTSAADSRLGNPVTFVVQDETGLWVKSNQMIRVAETQRRGVAGMGGRTLETTNCPDPAEDSVAWRTMQSSAPDVFRFWDPPPAGLSYKNKRERRRIHRHNYRHSPWVDIDSIEAEAAELMERDPAQAERFYGNRIVAASDSYFDAAAWTKIAADITVPDGAVVALGFDGSQYDDWTAIRARWLTEDTMHAFTPTFADGAPTMWDPALFNGEIPRAEVAAAVEELCTRYRVVRMYCDPDLWQSEIESWAHRWGEKTVVQWATWRTRPMAAALERFRTDVSTGALTQDADPTMLAHLRNARRVRRPGGTVIGKPNDHQKIDLVMSDVLAHEAACDARAAGLAKTRTRRVRILR